MPLQQRLITVAGFTVLILTVAIFAFLLQQSWPFLQQAGANFLTGDRWHPVSLPPSFEIRGFMVSTLYITAVAVAIGCPIGLVSAVSLSELLPARVSVYLRAVFEFTAGIPSVVFGFIGLRLVAPVVAQVLGLPTGLTGFTAGLVLSVMVLPTLVSLGEEALHAVPTEYADASYALGANRWQTIWLVIVPAARGGLWAAVLLALGRAMGETMTVLMVAGGRLYTPTSVFQPMRSIAALIASEVNNAPRNSEQYHALFAAGLVLFITTLLVNAIAARTIMRRSRRET